MKSVMYFLKVYTVEFVAFLVTVLSFICSNLIQSKLTINYSFSSEIILILLPTILTILSIVLSLPNELVCGIDMNSFRKLSKRKNYSFLEMLVIGVVIFVLYSISSIFELILPIWVLSIISTFYTFIFLLQEIPLLLKNERRILNIISQGYDKDKTNDDIKEAIQNLLMKEGMKYVYINLKKSNNNYNKILIEFLLSLQNDFLWSYLENVSDDLKNYNINFKQINIIEALEKLLGSVEDIIDLSPEMNILDIYESEEHFYHITRSLFSINKVISYYNLDKKNQKFARLFNNIFTNIALQKESTRAKRFYYKILNAMLTNTLSEGNLWFVKLLRDYSFSEGKIFGGSTEYMMFVANYLYYLVYLEDALTKKTKEEIVNFIDEISNNSDGYASTSFSNQLSNRLRYLDIDEYSKILNELIFIFESNNDTYFWFNRPSGVVYRSSFEKMFNIRILMNWWIALLLTDDTYHSYLWNNDITPIIPTLSDVNKLSLAVLLNEKWFKDDQINIENELTYFKMFGLKNRLEDYINDSVIVKSFREFKNKNLLDKIETEIMRNQIDDVSLFRYKEVLKKAFLDASDKLPFKDENLELDEINKSMFSFLCDTQFSDASITRFAEQIPAALGQIVFKSMNQYAIDNNLILKIKKYDKNILEKIIDFSPDYKYAYIPEHRQTEGISDLVKELNKLKPIEKFQLPRDLYIKKDAIKLKFEYDDFDTTARRLTEDEVNQIIDRDYKQVNGLYKYKEGPNDNSSVLLTREKLQSLVSKKFFLSKIVFKYKIEFDDSKFLYYEIIKD